MILFFLKNDINAIARSNKLETHRETASEEFVAFFPPSFLDTEGDSYVNAAS